MTFSQCGLDKKRKKYVRIDRAGLVSERSGPSYQSKIGCYFYKGFSEEEIRQFECYQTHLAEVKEKEA